MEHFLHGVSQTDIVHTDCYSLKEKVGTFFFLIIIFFNGASIRTELPFPRPKIWVAFFRTDLT